MLLHAACRCMLHVVRRVVSVAVRGEERVEVVQFVESKLKCQALPSCEMPAIPAGCLEASWVEFIHAHAKGFAART